MRPLYLAAVALIAASCPVIAATPNDRTQEWVRLDSEIQRATQAMASDADSARPAVEELLRRVDIINSASDAQREESTLSRAKREALRGPLYNLRLALEQPVMASQIAKHAIQPRGPLMSAEGVAGVSCEEAIELVPNQPMRIEIPGNASRWITVRSPLGASAPLAISTLGSDIDAAVSVYEDCRETGKTAISSGDDNYGLQAIVLLPPAAHPLLVELRNQGERGIAFVDAISAVTINGRVTRSDTAAPISNMRIDAYRGSNAGSTQYAGSSTSMGNGDYQLVPLLINGANTYVRTFGPTNQPQFVDQAWNNILCMPASGLPDCGPGTPSAAATGDDVTVFNIDFSLTTGATIYGQVVDRSGNAVSGAKVSISKVGTPPATARTTLADVSGRYRMNALPNGQYRVEASASGYKSQIFREFDCDIDCGQIAGNPVVAVEFGQSLANFSLSRGGSIHVSVTVDGQPTSATSYVYAADPAGTVVAQAYASAPGSAPGSIGILGPLPTGTYRVRVEGAGLASEYYQDIVCADACGPAEFQAATPILISNDAPPVAIRIDLAQVPELTGIVTSTSGGAIPNAVITLVRDNSIQASTQTLSDGTYRVRAPALGGYVVHASSLNHVDEAYDDVPCANALTASNCLGTTMVNFAFGTVPPTADFELSPSATIRGRVTKLRPNQSFQISALTTLNQGIGDGRFSQLSDGTYQLADLPEGQFHFGLLPGSGGRLQLYQNLDCGAQASLFTQCPASGATPVKLVNGSVVQGIDFSYRSRYGRLGQVTDEQTGFPLPGIIIDVFTIQGGDRFGSTTTDIDGRFDVAPAYGGPAFAVATDNYFGYVNEIYNNIECAVGSVYLGTCPLTGATPVAFPGDGSELLIALRREDVVFQSGFD